MLNPGEVSCKAEEAARFLKSALGSVPPIAVVLGSGWDVLADGYAGSEAVDFESIPGFAAAGVRGHGGSVRVVDTDGGRLLVQEGRLHCYEGLSALEVSFPVWVMSALGVKLLVMFSAAGGLNPAFIPGDLMIIADHVLLLVPNPLTGLPESPGRTPFVHGKDIYPARWQDALKECLPAEARCERGVYACVSGPSYETPAEALMLRLFGADAVGMSTAPEALAARYLGLEVAAMACISNSLIPPSGAPPSHELVLKVVRGVAAGLPGMLERLAARADMVT